LEDLRMAEVSTCGQGLARHAVLASKMAALNAAMAENLIAHVAVVSGKDDAAQQERRTYRDLADRYGDAAMVLAAIGNEMASQRDLPVADHDLSLMSSENVITAIQAMVNAEDELAALLRDLAAEHRAVVVELARTVQ
jgi:hypothetical protein